VLEIASPDDAPPPRRARPAFVVLIVLVVVAAFVVIQVSRRPTGWVTQQSAVTGVTGAGATQS
jgi:hypothetical protein